MGEGGTDVIDLDNTIMLRLLHNSRVYIGVALFVCAFVLPTLLTLFIGALLSLRFARYYELPAVALLIDALYRPYGATSIGLFGIALLYVLIVDYLRIRIRMRDNHRLY